MNHALRGKSSAAALVLAKGVSSTSYPAAGNTGASCTSGTMNSSVPKTTTVTITTTMPRTTTTKMPRKKRRMSHLILDVPEAEHRRL
jgi:hypothetical protein